MQGTFERQQPRLVHQRQQLHAKSRLQSRVLEQLIEHLTRLSATLELHHHRNAIAVRRVANVGADVGDDALVDQLGHALNEQRFVDLEGQLSDVDLRPVGVGPRSLRWYGHAAH